MDRREVLAALAGGSVLGAVGCTGQPAGVEVIGIEILNMAWTPRSVTVELRDAGEVVWTETEQVAVDTERPLECTWPRTPDDYTVVARLASGDGRAERDLTDAESSPVGTFIVVGLQGSIGIKVTSDYTRPAGFSGTCE